MMIGQNIGTELPAITETEQNQPVRTNIFLGIQIELRKANK